MDDDSELYHLDESGYDAGHDFSAVDTALGENPAQYDWKRVDDAVSDANRYIENDGRSVTQTGFDPSDADDEYEKMKFERWNQINDGKYSPGRKERNREANRHRDAEAFMSELGCSQYQHDRVLHLLDSHDGGSMGGTTTEEILILGVISLVVEEDHCSDRTIRDEQQWDELRASLDVPQWKIDQVWDLLGRRNLMSDNQTGGALHS